MKKEEHSSQSSSVLLVFGMNYGWHFWDENLLDVWVLGSDAFGSGSIYPSRVYSIFLRLHIFMVHGGGFLSCFQSYCDAILLKMPSLLIRMTPREKLELQQ